METAEIHTRIEERAYYIWEGEGRPAGRALDHWLRAESELTVGAGPRPKRLTSSEAAREARAARSGAAGSGRKPRPPRKPAPSPS